MIRALAKYLDNVYRKSLNSLVRHSYCPSSVRRLLLPYPIDTVCRIRSQEAEYEGASFAIQGEKRERQ